MADHAHGTDDRAEVELHHAVPVRTYLAVFTWLMVLLVITLVAAAIDLGAVPNLIIAMVIAVTKAILIFLYFMHLKFSSLLVKVFAWGAIFWLGIMFFLTLSDYVSRVAH